MSSEKVAVVTGSNKGIGFGIVKQLCEQLKPGSIVYLTARDEGRGQAAVKELEKLGLSPKFHLLDIDNLESIIKFRDDMKNTHGGIDILVNNAAIAFKHDATEPFGHQANETIRVNYFAILDVCRELFPLLNKGARVVNVSSSVGHLTMIKGQEPQAGALRARFSDPSLKVEQLNQLMNEFIKAANEGNHHECGWPGSTYAVSKVGLSALTRIQQKDFDAQRPGDDIVVNSVHPGYVDTDMTSHKGPLTIEQGAAAPVWCALLPPWVTIPRGGYVWYDKEIYDWDGPSPGAY
jgi:carbonyl reductase 1